MISIKHQEFGFEGKPIRIVAGDVGGTKTHLALFISASRRFERVHVKTYKSRVHNSFSEMLIDFIGGQKKPDCISIGVAGPVFSEHVELTNLGWSIDLAKVRHETKISHVHLLNDLVANIYGLSTLESEDFVTFYEGTPSMPGNAAIISPGTGLGEAGLFWDGTCFHPFGCEGGHADYAPDTAEDIELLKYLSDIYGHVSWERVVSGRGIQHIFDFLSDYHQLAPTLEIKKQLETGDAAAIISKGAKSGDKLCQQSMQMFWRNLANEAANLVMKLNAVGGVFIGGGIVPKNLDVLRKEEFIHFFLEAGRMKKLLQHVPVRVVLNDQAALRGAALFGAIRYRMALS